MEKKISLEEILWLSFHNNGIPKPTHTLAEITQKAVKEAMKEACRQTLDLVVKDIKLKKSMSDYGGRGVPTLTIDKKSILKVIDKIE